MYVFTRILYVLQLTIAGCIGLVEEWNVITALIWFAWQSDTDISGLTWDAREMNAPGMNSPGMKPPRDHHRECSAVRQVLGVQLRQPTLSSALLFIGPYEPSISSSIIPILLLPRVFFPSILPSITLFEQSPGSLVYGFLHIHVVHHSFIQITISRQFLMLSIQSLFCLSFHSLQYLFTHLFIHFIIY